MQEIIVSKEQQKAFRDGDKGYHSHIPYNNNSNKQTIGEVYNTTSFTNIYDAVRDYYNTREWN